MLNSAKQVLVAIALHLPALGHCDSWDDRFKNAFGSTDVAVKVRELREPSRAFNVRGLDFSPDGKHIAIVSTKDAINIWDWQSGRIVRTLEKVQAANDGLSSEPLRYSPDGRWLVSCHNRAAGHVVARIWRTDTWEIAHDMVDDVPGSGCNAVAFTPDSKLMIRVLDRSPIISGDTLVVYDTATWQPIWGMRTPPFYTRSLATSPNGRLFALGGEVLNPVEWRSSAPKPTFGDPPFANTSLLAIADIEKRAIVKTVKHTGAMDSRSRLVWSPDGLRIANAGGEGIQIFDAQSGQLVVNVPARWQSERGALRYSPDGKYLIEGFANAMQRGWGKIWDAQHDNLLQEISENVGGIAVSADARHLATGVDGKTIIWQLR